MYLQEGLVVLTRRIIHTRWMIVLTGGLVLFMGELGVLTRV